MPATFARRQRQVTLSRDGRKMASAGRPNRSDFGEPKPANARGARVGVRRGLGKKRSNRGVRTPHTASWATWAVMGASDASRRRYGEFAAARGPLIGAAPTGNRPD